MPNILVHNYLSPRIIEVLVPDTEITVQEVVNLCKEWEQQVINLDDDPLISASGKEDLGGGVAVGISATLLNAKLAFSGRTTPLSSGLFCDTADPKGRVFFDADADFISDGIYGGCTIFNNTTKAMSAITGVVDLNTVSHFPLSGGSSDEWTAGDSATIYPNVQCSISGGNLVAVDADGLSTSAIYPTPNVQMVRTAASSATSSDIAAIQYASFNGGITVDTTSLFSGIKYPVGTPQAAVNNLFDAKEIADSRGFVNYYIVGDIVLDDVIDFTGDIFIGSSKTKSLINILSDANVTNSEFYEAEVTGILDGGNVLKNCVVHDINYVNGYVEQCVLTEGDIVLGGGSQANFLDCWSGEIQASIPVIDMGGSGQSLSLRNYNGGLKIKNKTGPEEVIIDLNSGNIILDSTITGGTIILRGIGTFVDNSTGSVIVDTSDLLNSYNITKDSWRANLDHIYLNTDSGISGTDYPAGTSGYPVNNIIDALAIAVQEGVKALKIRGSVTLPSSVAGWTFSASSVSETTIELNNQDVEHTVFKNTTLTGICNGSIYANDCVFDNTKNLKGIGLKCVLYGSLSIATTGQFNVHDVRGFDPDIVHIDFNNTGVCVLTKSIMHLEVTNMTDVNALFVRIGVGNITLGTSNTDGTVLIGPDGLIIDDGYTGVVIADNTTREHVWQDPRALRIKGLSQENQFMDQTVYDSNSQLISARIRLYDSAANVGTDNGVIATYTVTSTYSGTNLTNYKVELL